MSPNPVHGSLEHYVGGAVKTVTLEKGRILNEWDVGSRWFCSG